MPASYRWDSYPDPGDETQGGYAQTKPRNSVPGPLTSVRQSRNTSPGAMSVHRWTWLLVWLDAERARLVEE